MSKQNPRVLVMEFHEETNTFNPIVCSFEIFNPAKVFEGKACLDARAAAMGCISGSVAAIKEMGGEVIPSVYMHAPSGGRVDDAVLEYLKESLTKAVAEAGELDGICCHLHGATCTETCDDACGVLVEHLRALAPDAVIASSYDLHANITDRTMRSVDIICGYNTYPHVDHYSAGYRAAKLMMETLQGKEYKVASTTVDILIPPAGFTTIDGPFKELTDKAHQMVKDGKITDFTIFAAQPWLDIQEIASRIITIGEDAEIALACADELAEGLLALRDDVQPDLMSIDEIIDIAEKNDTGRPVILADSADSPNGGCVGDSPAVALRLQERGSKLRTCMFIVDPEGAKKAHELGVGAKAEFSIGAGFTPGMPGPFKAEGVVHSLHDGHFRYMKNASSYIGLSAVVHFGNIEVLLCDHGALSGSPTLFRAFWMEPYHYDLVVVKANTSFKVPYAEISSLIYMADTPGAGASNLKRFEWKNLRKGLYPFDLPEGYTPEKAKLW